MNLNVDPEFQAVGQALQVLIKNLKAKKYGLLDFEQVLSPLLAEVGSLKNIGQNWKKPENLASLAYFVAGALIVVPAVAALASDDKVSIAPATQNLPLPQ